MANPTLLPVLSHVRHVAGLPGHSGQTDAHLLGRFRAAGDQEAFAALVRRHGPAVWAACRRVLADPADVEDAFQATFLVLVRKAGAVRWRASVGNWLYGVAHRVAVRARATAQRRQRHESAAGRPADGAAAPPDLTWREAVDILHEELNRLPDKFRLPLLLCYLEGLSRDEAAARLGRSASTVKGRLESGRKLLRARLTRRGIGLSAGLLAGLAAEPGRAAGVPRELIRTTAQAAAGGSPSAAAAALARGVTAAMMAGRIKYVAVVALMVGVCAAGAGVGLVRSGGVPAEPPAADAPAPAAIPAVAPDAVTITGRVFGPDGRPAAGAKLYVCDDSGKRAAPQPAADADGRFRFALAADPARSPRFLLAASDGLGLDWADLRHAGPEREVTLRLPADVRILGKVVDLQGRPVAGATVRIVELSTSESGNLDEFVKQWAADKEKLPGGPAFRLLTGKSLWSAAALKQLPAATTGADGTFRLDGIGRDRGLMLGVRGPGLADHYVRVVTRPDFPASPGGGRQVALSGPEPVVPVSPAKPIAGTLRDAQTKQPLAGVRVLAYTPSRPIHWWWQPVETVTDAQGRYRLDGLAKAAQQIVTFDPGCGAPHLHRFDPVGDTAAFDPITHDAELYRGVVVSGQVTDRSTGRPVRARVVYAPLRSNEHYASTPGYDRPRTQLVLWIDSREMTTGADGRYRLTALPDPGALFVQATAGQFTHPAVAPEDRDPAIFSARSETFLTLGLGDIFPLSSLHAYRLIRPAVGATDVTADFALDPGLRHSGRLVDPDGRPLAGAEAMNLAPPSAWKVVLPAADFTAEALNPAKPRRLLFWHHERKLAGTVVLRGDEPEPVTVTLQPLAAITGRAVLKGSGEPLVGHAVEYSAWPELEWPVRTKGGERVATLTDNDGRFRLTDLPAGVPLNVSVIVPKTRFATIHVERVTLAPRQTKDLGDLKGDRRPDGS
jgi:RNA polymerase sigma factor (sigma-70 family)